MSHPGNKVSSNEYIASMSINKPGLPHPSRGNKVAECDSQCLMFESTVGFTIRGTPGFFVYGYAHIHTSMRPINNTGRSSIVYLSHGVMGLRIPVYKNSGVPRMVYFYIATRRFGTYRSNLTPPRRFLLCTYAPRVRYLVYTYCTGIQ